MVISLKVILQKMDPYSGPRDNFIMLRIVASCKFNLEIEKFDEKVLKSVLSVIVQTGLGGISPISKHREEWKRTSTCFEIGGSPLTNVI